MIFKRSASLTSLVYYCIVIEMSSHRVYVKLIAIPEEPKGRTRRGQAIRRWKEESQTRLIDPRFVTEADFAI